ncbi:MAG TPA: Hsp20/alpha crystallin family protein [Candidatus Cybelea sp.]|nr:Hsp20/alpha crystallin family protein [Candidatus Cybelea sp.]
MANTPVDVKKTTAVQSPPTGALQSFRSEMDRLFDRFAGSYGFPSFRRMFDVEPFWRSETTFGAALPAVDITEDDKAYKIAVEVPGMSEKEIDIAVTGDTISVKGEKRQEHEEKGKNRYVSERSYGAFQRSFELPDGIDRDKIAASLANGVLTVTLPKTVEAQKQQKKIEVKAA